LLDIEPNLKMLRDRRTDTHVVVTEYILFKFLKITSPPIKERLKRGDL